MDRHTMFLIGSTIAALLFAAYMMFGPDGISVPR